MTKRGKDHWLSDSSSTPPEDRLTQLEIRLIELEVHCANLTTKLLALEALLLGDLKDV